MSTPNPTPRPVPVARSAGRESNGELPPITGEDFDEITDFFLWDSDDPSAFADSFCFFDHPYPRPIAGTPVGERMQDLLSFIRSHDDFKHQTDFQVTYQDKYVFRAHRDPTVQGTQICLRRVKESVPRAQDLAWPAFWREVLLSNTLNDGGLVILASKPGSGKSTTIAAMVRSRLEMYGGFCKTIEAPPEYPLQNRWGKGVCFQVPVNEDLPRDQQFAVPLRGLLRGYPTIPGGGRTIMVVGETRDKETAAEVVTQSVGHLVITTMHALDIESAVSRFCGMAGQVLGPDVAREMVSSALRIVATQRLERVEGGNGWTRRRMEGDLLFSRGGFTAIGNMIKKGEFTGLVGECIKQKRMLEDAHKRSQDADAVLSEISPDVRNMGGGM